MVDNNTNKQYTSKSVCILVHISGERGKHSRKNIKMLGRRYNIMNKRNNSDEKLEMSFLSGWK